MLNTERLILRPWRDSDAASLYHYAKDERVGPIAGWPPHRSEAESLEIIQTIFSGEDIYAVALSTDDVAIGMIGLLKGKNSNFPLPETEAEVAYWIGVPFWGQGLIPEALRTIMQHSFQTLQLEALWCGYFSDNEQSFKAQAKCGFLHHHTEEKQFNQFMNDYRTEHISRITKEEWLQQQA
ncbi:GNAT family N-acetyltransferase [Paenalcaligenes sp. Me52]|uniref:GNAT family N-acetyltransferase n=1 Tax=Paenalcaligenes sp. Me52 TaxID=3392038 RepID=UPI003D2AA094